MKQIKDMTEQEQKTYEALGFTFCDKEQWDINMRYARQKEDAFRVLTDIRGMYWAISSSPMGPRVNLQWICSELLG
jgi:hypothetical protein